MGNIWSSIADVSVHLAQDAYVLIAIEKRVLVLAVHASAAGAPMRRLVGFETGIGEDDDEAR